LPEQGRDGQQAERRALVADLVRTQAVLQARSEQLRRIFASRWYRLARFGWRLRRGRVVRRGEPPRMAGEGSFAQPLDELTAELDRRRAAGPPLPGLDTARGGPAAALETARGGAPAASAGGGRGGPAAGDHGPTRLLIAGHSLGFCEEIAHRARRAGASVREDRWSTHGEHDEAASAAALAWADVVHCEWCLGNAAWYSRNKRPGQRLVVRFHRMELETEYPGEIELEAVDAIVFVARHVLEAACERFGWDAGDRRFHVLPNGIDTASLRLPKLPGAEFTLAAIGYVPRLKRLDRALDLLEELRARDDRYRLAVKGREPWEHAWMAGREGEREYYEGLARRLEREPALRGAVEFEPFGDDVAEFLRRAGWIVSTSEVEGDSVSLAEGMASGAVPVVFERPGAAEQYEARWVHADAEAAAAAILAAQPTSTLPGGGESRMGGAESVLATALGTLSGQEHVESPQRGGGRDLVAQAKAARHWAESRSWERLGPAWDELLTSSDRAAAVPPASG
jgi:glycosyltransferase involved in cell wall biosynthesis